MDTYSWGEFYEATKTCENYEEIKEKFAIFEALDNSKTVEEIIALVGPLKDEQINWLNSPCLDGIVFSIYNPRIEERLLEQKKEFIDTYKYYASKKIINYNLISATKYGHLQIVTFLLGNNRGIEWYSNDDLCHSLCYASQNGYYEIIKLLLECNNTNVNTKLNVQEISEPFLAACEGGYIEIVKLLLENGTDIHYYWESALKTACGRGRLEIVKFLIENGADIHVHDEQALRNACTMDINVVIFLLEKGARFVDNHFLHGAIACNKIEIAEFLFQKGQFIPDENQITEMKHVIQEGYIDMVKFLLGKGFRLPENSLQIATNFGREKMVNFLLDFSENSQNDKNTALEWACTHGRYEMTQLLLKRGAVPTNKMLEEAFSMDDIKMIQILLDCGVDPQSTINCFNKRFQAVKMLLQN